jgi:octaheme c-type cytochrome (tetrathionate reductase family)
MRYRPTDKQLSSVGSYLLAVFLALSMVLYAAHAVAEGTANHRKFEVLQQDFKSGPKVTRACLSCHTEAARQVMKTQHWKWESINPKTSQKVGKKALVNNFCIGIAGNYADCTSCHIGYGYKDRNFDFTAEENVDCLVCHDTTGTYRKPFGLAGHPVYEDMEWPPGSGKILRAVDLTKVAQNVGPTSRYTCGACHFYGGHGNASKHGDLDSSLEVADSSLDVHMDVLGLDFSCSTCHLTGAHKVSGSRYQMTVERQGPLLRGMQMDRNPVSCESCHGKSPHSAQTMENIEPLKGFTAVSMAAIVNRHNDKLACQTCHIPAMARGGYATKMLWDWSTAGKMDANGKPYHETDDKGNLIYESKKGTFIVAENAIPEYVWFNGTVEYTHLGDVVEKTDDYVPINRFIGGPDDGKSRIWPVKVMLGVQPYDPVNKTLVIPKIYSRPGEKDSYSTSFNWEKAIAAGMAEAGADFSGKVDFIKTRMIWPITHMVAPSEDAVACEECHSSNGDLSAGRMKSVPGLKKRLRFKYQP